LIEHQETRLEMTTRSDERFTLPGIAAALAGGFALAYPTCLALMFRSHDWILAAKDRPAVQDFLVFWLAGRAALHGAAGAAYDPHFLHSAEVAAAGHEFAGQLPWRYSPHFLFVVAALALLPYMIAFLVWVGSTLAAYSIAISRIAGARLALVLACATPAVFLNAICGQNGSLTAALIGASLLTLEERPVLSGILLGLLAYKPQFGILFPLALAAGGYWRAMVAAAIATSAMIMASGAIFGFDALRAFVHFLPITSSTILVHGVNGFNKLQTVYGLLRWLGFGNSAAWAAQAIAISAVAAALLWLWRRDVPYALKAAALATATLLATPHLYMYDFVILAVPLAFLYREHGFDRTEIAGIAFANLCILAFTCGILVVPIGSLATATVGILVARRLWQLHTIPVEQQAALQGAAS
jgi:hypothetical protein